MSVNKGDVSVNRGTVLAFTRSVNSRTVPPFIFDVDEENRDSLPEKLAALIKRSTDRKTPQ